ncbi:hypothetical protein DRO42_02505 [Candidatus Bathyarchaeota archaeon]|nr:MAG: hypothetical protein DRO42_02505 [Candidatus Bathyarchaeota archaeon]
MPLNEDVLRGRLQSFYKRNFTSRRNIEVHNLKRVTGGWENEIYSFTLRYEEGRERRREDLILRIYPGNDAPQKSAREFGVMKRLHEVGFPVPRVLHLEMNSSLLGRPFIIMEKIDGRLLSSVFLASPPERRRELMTLFCKLFVDLHALDWRPFARFILGDAPPYEAADPHAFIKRKLSQMRRSIDHFRKHDFDAVLEWLEAGSADVPCTRLSLIHGDYHPENMLLREDGAPFVIDWGAVDIADFRSDLAWTILLTSTYGGPEMREVILCEYERISGQGIEQIEYFEVMAIFRRLFDISVSLSEGAGERGMRPGAETMIKQDADHIKRVYALLLDRTGITLPEIERLISTLT